MKVVPAIKKMQPFAIALCAILLTACGPDEKQRAALAEKKRIECLDTICAGDVEPKRDYAKVALLKLNGQWYIGPNSYYSSGLNGAVFYWPTKAPGFASGDFSKDVKGKEFQDIAIEIFLRGRQNWPDPKAVAPWAHGSWERTFAKQQQEGWRIERQQLHPGLERVRLFDAQGLQYRNEFFLATKQKRPFGDSLPGISCDIYPDKTPGRAHARCSGNFFWQEDVYADFRLPAKYANDWPEIYQEITRVLTLLKKAQP